MASPTSTPAKKPTPVNNLAEMEALFANAVGKGTGFDPRVIFAQTQVEGAYAPGGTGGLNFLNLKSSTVSSLGQPYAGSTSAGFAQFASLAQAEQATIAEFRSPTIGIKTPGPTPEDQIAQIAASPWDAGHYGGAGGPSLVAEFRSLYGANATATAGSSGNVLTGSPSGLYNPTTGTPVLPAPSGLQQAQGAISSVTGLISWITNTKNLQRAGEMVGGSVLILLGLVMIGRGAASSAPASQVAGAAQTTAAPVRAVQGRRTDRKASEQRARTATARTQAAAAREARSSALYNERLKTARARTSKTRAEARSARAGANESKRRAERARGITSSEIAQLQMVK